MPSRKIKRNMGNKRNFSTANTRKPKKKWGFENNLTSKQVKDINDMLYQQAKYTKGKESWKVVPKDSYEVYKDRRKRKLNAERNKEEKSYNEDYQDNRKDNSNGRVRKTYKRITRRGKRHNPRKRDLDSTTTCSTLSYCTTCSRCMEYE